MNVTNTKYFIHPKALCESVHIGEQTRVWAFTHILPEARIGAECNICDYVFIENKVIIGNRVTIKCGVQIWDGVQIADDVFVGPNVTFTNDAFPRSKIYPEQFSQTIIHKGASIGANATILPGITIGTNAMIGAGAVVTRSVPPNAVVAGNPAKIIRYINTTECKINDTSTKDYCEKEIIQTSVSGVTIHNLRVVPDLRGKLTVGEFERQIPFKPSRFFLVYDVPSKEVRGEHAHHKCQQFLIAINGSVRVVVENKNNREELTLDRNNLGLYLPAMIWGVQYHYSKDAILLVFASDWYDQDDYIRDYSEYLNQV